VTVQPTTPTQVIRWIDYRGERLKIEQFGDTCTVFDGDGYPYARLSKKLDDGKMPPEGFFWLRWWSENQHLAEALLDLGVLKTHGETIQITHWVTTVAARIAPEVIA
jgi:hypothetical protein